MIKKWEIHFAEGAYFIANEVGTPSMIIENTFTEFIDEFETDTQGIQVILLMLTKAYELQKIFPLESINKPVETTNEQPEICNCKRSEGSCEGIFCKKMQGKKYTGICIFDHHYDDGAVLG